jgi:hypothetical protein
MAGDAVTQPAESEVSLSDLAKLIDAGDDTPEIEEEAA